MNATGKYIIFKESNNDEGLRLIFEINGWYLRDWYIPNIVSLCKSKKLIAIEKNIIKDENPKPQYIDYIFRSKDKIYKKLDSGKVIINYMSDSKYDASILSEIIQNKILGLVMIIPSWGRWTANNLWIVIIK